MINKDIRQLRSQIETINTLPTLPDILKRLLVVIENPNVSLNEISNFILSDPVLTSKILKVVNSPIYGFPGRISSINQALMLLGLNVVKGMLFGVSVFDVMQKTMIGLWEHSLSCAVTARIIAKKKNFNEPEEVSIAALLHDIGKVVLGLKFPEGYGDALKDAENKGVFIFDSEKSYFGITHANAGSWIAQKWNFPSKLIDVIQYHHTPKLSKNAVLHTAIVHLSDIIVKARGIGFTGDKLVPAIDPFVWEYLNLSEDAMFEVFMELEDSLEDIENFFLSGD